MLQQQQQHLLPFTPLGLQQSTHKTPWSNRKNPFIPRKRYFMSKITTRSRLGSGGAAKCHIPPPVGLSRAVPNSLDKGSSFPQAGALRARPAHPSSLKAEAATQAPNEGSCRSSNYLCNQLTTSLPAPFMAFYCPAGTKKQKMKWKYLEHKIWYC